MREEGRHPGPLNFWAVCPPVPVSALCGGQTAGLGRVSGLSGQQSWPRWEE